MRAVFGLLFISAGIWVLYYLFKHGPFSPEGFSSTTLRGPGG